MTLGEKIKQLRTIRDWSQRELAERSGVLLSTIKAIERRKRTHPRTDVLLKLAGAFEIEPQELYEAAGYEVGEKAERRVETPEELLRRLELIQPASIPVYTEFQMYPTEVREEPIRFIYRIKEKAVGRNIEAYEMKGQHLKPMINDGDVVLVDKDQPGEAGDLILTVIGGKTVVGRVVLVDGELWIRSFRHKTKFSACHSSAKIIEIRKHLE